MTNYPIDADTRQAVANSYVMPRFTSPKLPVSREEKRLNARWQQTQKDAKALRKANSELRNAAAVVDADVELREDVINALVKKGFARTVAANRTNTTQRMLAEAKLLRLI